MLSYEKDPEGILYNIVQCAGWRNKLYVICSLLGARDEGEFLMKKGEVKLYLDIIQGSHGVKFFSLFMHTWSKVAVTPSLGGC